MSNTPWKTVRASAGSGEGAAPQVPVAKLIDVGACIGCKACEVACKEWNERPFVDRQGDFGTYQTAPDLTPDLWNLVRFNEATVNNTLVWTMTKFQCMHCADPGCMTACPAPGAVVKYPNGIVDFVEANCIGCRLCITGCPFDVPRLSPSTGKVYKCTLCADRVADGLEPACVKACPTDCLQFGAKTQLVQIGQARVDALREQGYEKAALYNPPGVGGTHVLYVLPQGDQPDLYSLPDRPRVSVWVSLWAVPLRRLGNLFLWGGVLATVLHYLRFGERMGAGRLADDE